MIERRTPLPRSPLPPRKQPLRTRQVPLERSGTPERSARPRPRSEKVQRLYDEVRRPLVERLLRERPRCQAELPMCTHFSVDVHEVKSRGRGGSIVAEENLITVCRPCHDRITANASCPDLIVRGLSAHSWD